MVKDMRGEVGDMLRHMVGHMVGKNPIRNPPPTP